MMTSSHISDGYHSSNDIIFLYSKSALIGPDDLM